MSTSYPFLTTARRIGADYGLVLAWADVESAGLCVYGITPHQREAHARLTDEQKEAVYAAVVAERHRRAAVENLA